MPACHGYLSDGPAELMELSATSAPFPKFVITPQHILTRTSETKGHEQLNDSSAAFRFEGPNRVCCRWCRTFKSAALASVLSPAHARTADAVSIKTGAALPFFLCSEIDRRQPGTRCQRAAKKWSAKPSKRVR